MKIISFLLTAGLSGLSFAAPIQSDSFSGAVIDGTKWQQPPYTDGNGVFSQNNGLYYHNNGSGTDQDEVNLTATGVASVASDWTVRFDAHVPDLAALTTPGQSVGLEMKIWNSADENDRADIQTSILQAPAPYGKVRTLGADITNDSWQSDPAPGGSTGVFLDPSTQSQVTLAFSWSASTTTLSAWYAPAGGGTDWIRLTSWQLGAGSPTEWSLGTGASFMFYIGGSSQSLNLVTGDNVRITDFVVSGTALSGRIPPTITTGDNPSRPDFIPLPQAAVGNLYSTTIQANGGALPHTWSLIIGSLPAGLELDPATGTIHGTPMTAVTSNFRARVTGADGAYAEGSYSIEVSVPTPPAVTTSPATGVTATSATLNGTVNPNGSATTAQFEYGLTTAYGSTASVTLTPNNDIAAQNVSAAISGLQGGRTYHCRLAATNAGGTTPGGDQTFTTPVPPVTPGELVAPTIAIVGSNVEFAVQQTVFGRRYQLQQSETMAPGSWVDVGVEHTGDSNELVLLIPYEPLVPRRFYRLALDSESPVLDGFALIPAGWFEMGDQSDPLVGYSNELPVHSVYVSGFYMGRYEVTQALWNEVRAWGLNHGYTDLWTGLELWGVSKGPNHPVQGLPWYEMVKWCNARSEKENRTPCYRVDGAVYKIGNSDAVTCNWSADGYRLPTEAEWEKASRGGLSGKNFPWGDTISHSQANYYSYWEGGVPYDNYDVNPTSGYHPTYIDPVTGNNSSPVGSFAPNGYGLYDMAGNVPEWCWDRYADYPSTSQTDPRGRDTGSYRVIRGGSWGYGADRARCADRLVWPDYLVINDDFGFRLARGQP